MVPVISIVGKSDSGKTTLIEKLIPELSRRGYVVGTIKHDAHKFDIDHPGKDSWRHAQAGAATTVISSPAKVAIVKTVDRELTLDEITAAYLMDVDIVLTEGFKREAKPKIELLANNDIELISPVGQVFLIASDDKVDLGPPTAKRDDVETIVAAIEEKFLSTTLGKQGVQLVVDGKDIPLNAIMKSMVAKTISGLVSSLKGSEEPRNIEVRIGRKQKKDKN